MNFFYIPDFPTKKQKTNAILSWYWNRPSIFHIFKLIRWYKEGAFFK